MSENCQYEIWKIPDVSMPFPHDYQEIGIYPTGELMGVRKSRDSAEDLLRDLEAHSPSERFGETMEDAPYRFTINTRYVGE